MLKELMSLIAGGMSGGAAGGGGGQVDPRLAIIQKMQGGGQGRPVQMLDPRAKEAAMESGQGGGEQPMPMDQPMEQEERSDPGFRRGGSVPTDEDMLEIISRQMNPSGEGQGDAEGREMAEMDADGDEGTGGIDGKAGLKTDQRPGSIEEFETQALAKPVDERLLELISQYAGSDGLGSPERAYEQLKMALEQGQISKTKHKKFRRQFDYGAGSQDNDADNDKSRRTTFARGRKVRKSLDAESDKRGNRIDDQ